MYRVEIRPLDSLHATYWPEPCYQKRTEAYEFTQEDDARAFALALRERISLAAWKALAPITQTVVLWETSEPNPYPTRPTVIEYC